MCVRRKTGWLPVQRADTSAHVQDECPPREVRAFRVLVVSDASGEEGGGGPSGGRTAQLTVWDFDALEDVRVDGQYAVWNTSPAGRFKATDTCISLATRRDTRWQRL